MSGTDALRRAAGEEAVGRYVRDGMRLGLGTGSTAALMLEALAARIAAGALRDIAGVPTSDATAAACRGSASRCRRSRRRPGSTLSSTARTRSTRAST